MDSPYERLTSPVHLDSLSGLCAELSRFGGDISEEYGRRLAASGNPLGTNPDLLTDVQAQALAVLSEIEVMSQTYSHATARDHEIGGSDEMEHGLLGSKRAAARVHPRFSIAAGAVLFDVIMGRISLTESVSDQRNLAIICNFVITSRIAKASVGYSSELLAEVVAAHNSERLRISRDLHDRVGHDVHLAYRQLELSQIHGSGMGTLAHASLEKARLAVKSTMEGIRQILIDLRTNGGTGSLADSLEASFKDLVHGGLEDAPSLNIAFSGDEKLIPKVILDQVFLILREAIRNSCVHSGASQVNLLIDVSPYWFSATVSDDGSGLVSAGTGSGSGSGLSIMAERASILNAEFEVSPNLDDIGSVVKLSVPLSGGTDG